RALFLQSQHCESRQNLWPRRPRSGAGKPGCARLASGRRHSAGRGRETLQIPRRPRARASRKWPARLAPRISARRLSANSPRHGAAWESAEREELRRGVISDFIVASYTLARSGLENLLVSRSLAIVGCVANPDD